MDLYERRKINQTLTKLIKP